MTFVDEKGEWLDHLWSAVDEVIAAYSDPRLPKRYALVSDGLAERYGGFERVLMRRDEDTGLNRYVVVAVVPEPVWDQEEPNCAVQLWAAADDGTHFGRQLVASGGAWGTAGIRRLVSRSIDGAMQRAEMLDRDDLDGRYLHPLAADGQ